MRVSSMIRILLLCVVCGLAFGCSGSGDDTDEARGNVFSSRTGAIDKAKAVEQKIEDAAAKQRQAIEDQDR
jgi:hypothetical protein